MKILAVAFVLALMGCGSAPAPSAPQAQLSWQAGEPTVQTFTIYRNGAVLTRTPFTEFDDVGLIAGTQYCYDVTETVNGVESAPSNKVCVTP